MPGKRKAALPRPALPASDLEAKILALVKGARKRIKGITIFYIGDVGCTPNWFAMPSPARIPASSMKQFVAAMAQVRKDYDLQEDSNLNGVRTATSVPERTSSREILLEARS